MCIWFPSAPPDLKVPQGAFFVAVFGLFSRSAILAQRFFPALLGSSSGRQLRRPPEGEALTHSKSVLVTRGASGDAGVAGPLERPSRRACPGKRSVTSGSVRSAMTRKKAR